MILCEFYSQNINIFLKMFFLTSLLYDRDSLDVGTGTNLLH